MSQQYPGGYVTKTAPTVSNTAAPGIWTLDQAAQYQAAGTWPIPAGQQAFTTPGTYTWVAPQNVTSVSVVCVGAGGTYSPDGAFDAAGGGGGALAYANNITVVPGNSYTVVVGNIRVGVIGYGEDSSFNSTSVKAGGGQNGASGGGLGGSVIYGTGGSGGRGGVGVGNPGSGGGAGGYSGNGGAGGAHTSTGGNGSGGGGGGGAGSGGSRGGGGGGVGILGQGTSGAGGIYVVNVNAGGGGGSGGTDGSAGGGGTGAGGLYGGGSSQNSPSAGAVRIIWGYNRAFPSTNTGDV